MFRPADCGMVNDCGVVGTGAGGTKTCSGWPSIEQSEASSPYSLPQYVHFFMCVVPRAPSVPKLNGQWPVVPARCWATRIFVSNLPSVMSTLQNVATLILYLSRVRRVKNSSSRAHDRKLGRRHRWFWDNTINGSCSCSPRRQANLYRGRNSTNRLWPLASRLANAAC